MPRRALLDEERLRALALEQDRVVGRDQLAFLGADRHLVARRVDTGRLRLEDGGWLPHASRSETVRGL
jgi:hypothetical protein